MSKRVPGDEAVLNNIAGKSAAVEADEHEQNVQAAVARAKLEQEQRDQAAAQEHVQRKGPAPEVKEGTVSVPVLRKPADSPYGPELPWPHGTQLVKDADGTVRPTNGAEEATHVSARIMGKNGWLVQRAVPLEAMPQGAA